MALSRYGDAVAPTTSATLGTTDSTGDLLVVFSQGTSASVTFTDVTGNTYATPIVVGPDDFGSYIAMSWAIEKSGGTAQTVTAAGGTIDRTGIFAVTGFVHGPVVISGDTSQEIVTGSATSIATPGFTASKNSEFSVGACGFNGSTPTDTDGNYTFFANDYRLTSIAALSTDGYTSGTNLAFTATISPGLSALAIIQGFFDGVVSSGATIAWLT